MKCPMSDQSNPNPPLGPQLPAGAYTESVAPPPPSQSPNLNSDITDELTDHLALATRDLQLAGHQADEAQNLARQKFGDIAAIRRRLWWIHQGDEIMLRTAFAAVLVILVVAIAALGIGGWQMNQIIGELGATLASMNETQRALLESREKEDRPRAIRGRLYLGDKSKPASYASVDVLSLPEGKKVDTLMADEDGRFGTSSLPAGHYTILAPLLPQKNKQSLRPVPGFFALQSRPISVYPWSNDATVELDVAMVGYGQVSFELARPFPTVIPVEHNNATAAIFPALVIAIPSGAREIPVRELRSADRIEWPIVGLQNLRESDVQFFHSQGVSTRGNSPPEHVGPMLAGKPILYERVPNTSHADAFRAGTYTVEANITCREITNSSFVVVGQQAFGDEKGIVSPSSIALMPKESRLVIEVVDGRRTHLRITPPENLEAKLRAKSNNRSTTRKRSKRCSSNAIP